MNIELFKDAIEIVDGIPSHRIRLTYWQDDVRFGSEQPDKYYVRKPKHIVDSLRCCPGGWLCLHPKMRNLGLHANRKECGEPTYIRFHGAEALAAFFYITDAEADDLFAPRESTVSLRVSDKVLWRYRALILLAQYQSRSGDHGEALLNQTRAANLMNAQFPETSVL